MRYAFLFSLVVSLLLLDEASAKEPPALRVAVDAQRERIWALRPDGVHVYATNGRRKIAHVALPGWVVAGEPHGCLPDLALDRWGDAVVTSDILPLVWKVEAASFAVTRHELELDADRDREVGFAGLAWSPAHGAFFAISFHHGTLWRIGPQLDRAQKVDLSPPLPGACGLIVRPRPHGAGAGAATELCARVPNEWAIRLSPDQRSARAVRAACLD
jgi:hypothetical protein